MLFFAILAVAGFSSAGTSGADAAAANGIFAGKAAEATQGRVTEVSDRCGRNRHWSKTRHACIWN